MVGKREVSSRKQTANAALQRPAGGPRTETAYAGATHGAAALTMIRRGRSSARRPVKLPSAARMARSAVRHNHASPRPSNHAVATVATAWVMIIAQPVVPESAIGVVLCTL